MSEFKWCQIDPTTSTQEEIEKEIERLKFEMNNFNNDQMALKIFINSVYGATGNAHFICYNPDIAEAVTLQGQDLIKFTRKIVDYYFKEQWHNDKKLHEKLGVEVIGQVQNPVCIYIDTDSNYIKFEEVISTIKDFENSKYENGVDLILDIYNFRLKKFFNDYLEKYSKNFNTENLQVFELEGIAYAGIYLAKKKYMLEMAWKDSGGGIFFKKGSKIKSVGVEIVQSKTPKFARNKLETAVSHLFDTGKNFNMGKFIKQLRKLKDKFQLVDIEDISLSSKISNYEKYVISDRKEIELKKGAPIHVRAAAIHNWMVNNDPKLKRKYNLIKSGDKVKYFYVQTSQKELNVFGYLPGSFPIELNQQVPVNYDMMFEKIMLGPINRLMEATNNNLIPNNLVYVKTLF